MSGEFPHDAELFQVAQSLVDRGRRNACLYNQPTRGGDRTLQNDRCTRNVDAAARPSPLILSQSWFDRSMSCCAVSTAWAAVTMTASAKKSEDGNDSCAVLYWEPHFLVILGNYAYLSIDSSIPRMSRLNGLYLPSQPRVMGPEETLCSDIRVLFAILPVPLVYGP